MDILICSSITYGMINDQDFTCLFVKQVFSWSISAKAATAQKVVPPWDSSSGAWAIP
jgi:hypothetical protein